MKLQQHGGNQQNIPSVSKMITWTQINMSINRQKKGATKTKITADICKYSWIWCHILNRQLQKMSWHGGTILSRCVKGLWNVMEEQKKNKLLPTTQ